MLFKKKQQYGTPIGFTKPKKFLFIKIRSKPIYAKPANVQQAKKADIERTKGLELLHKKVEQIPSKPGAAAGAQQVAGQRKPTALQLHIAKIVEKHKDLENAMKEVGMRETPYDFVKRMLVNSIIISAVIAIAIIAMLLHYGLGVAGIILGAVLGYATYTVLFQRFLMFPLQKSKQLGKGVERDILFAARDLVVSLRSGMPLFNAITAVSTGYGDASKEFAKIVQLVQLGMPIEQAIDRASSESQSKTFKRIMLQASVSIKAGADIAGALQGVVEDVTQEREIELRRYGQRLNALAMFYMLFGVIFPSMGIAVAAILTTFINIFSVTPTVLLFALVGIFFLQIIFLNVMRGSRPAFSM